MSRLERVEKPMKKCKTIILTLLDVLEVWIPSMIFLAVFVMYMMMIVFRYILNWKISVLFEMTQILYLMCAMLAASYGGRTDRHVVFPLVYNKVSKKCRNIFRLTADAVVVVLAGMMIGPSWEAISFIARKKTSILKVPFHIIYMPFLIFMVLSMIYYFMKLAGEVLILVGKMPDIEDEDVSKGQKEGTE